MQHLCTLCTLLYLATLFPTICKTLSSSNYQKQLEGVCRLADQGVWDLKSVFDKTDVQHVKVDEVTIDTFLQVNILRKLEDQGDHYVFALFSFQEFFWCPVLCSAFPRKNFILSPTEPSEHSGSDRNVESKRKL